MIDRFQRLVEANSEANRYKWALDWKGRGGKVIGVVCSYVPVEVVYAAGMLPYRVTGVWDANTPLALVYRPPWGNPKNMRILESLLRGQLDFLDGVIATDYDNDLKRLWDLWNSLKKTTFSYIMYIPRTVYDVTYAKLHQVISKLIQELERFGATPITRERLWQAIDTYNHTRVLIRRLYELRKRAQPAVSGAEVLGITTAAGVMPPEEFNSELSALLPWLEQRRSPLKHFDPRLLVSSDGLDEPAYMKLIEDTGCVVAMDDLDTGSRLFWGEVNKEMDDPVAALAHRYLERPACPRMAFWPGQLKQLLDWVKEFNINGVLELPIIYSINRPFRTPFFTSQLKKAGVPFLTIMREYHLANEGQLQTRIGAFVEMIGQSQK